MLCALEQKIKAVQISGILESLCIRANFIAFCSTTGLREIGRESVGISASRPKGESEKQRERTKGERERGMVGLSGGRTILRKP